MATSTEAADATKEKPKKSKTMLIVAVLGVAIAGGGGAGGYFYMKSKAAAAGDHVEEAKKPEPAHPPAYLPMENMVVNLSDNGGERFAQLGITIELNEEKAAEKIKGYLPSIRSAVLLLTSQRTSEELLTREGKIKLANDIAVEVARPLGFADEMKAQFKEAAKAAKPMKPASGASEADSHDTDSDEVPKAKTMAKHDEKEGGNPVRGILFSSFIIQ